MIKMVEKKGTKKINKIIKSVSVKDTPKKGKIVKSLKQENKPQQEQQFFAKELATKMGIKGYDFLLIKREADLEDGSLITMSKMQELYKKVVGR